MARRTKRKAPRRRRSFSLVNAAFAYGYANIITQGLFETNPLSFVVGDAGLGIQTGSGRYSISELVQNPALLGNVADNAMGNLAEMAVKGIALGVSERVFKSVMRKPIGRINNQIMRPLLGAGIKM